jgi:streptogramin lyase
MNRIISFRQQWAMDARRFRGLGRKRLGGRRPRRIEFDPLEERRMLSTAPPVAEFPVRTGGGDPLGIVEDPKGNVWVMLGSQNIAEVSNNGSVIAQYAVPTYSGLELTNFQTWLDLITYDPADKKIWFGEVNGIFPGPVTGQLASLDPATGAITEYPILESGPNGIPPFGSIVAGSDGNIWFTEPFTNQIGMFDIKTHQVNQFNMPLADTQPQAMTLGPDGNLWFTEGGQNKIGSINPISHAINEYAFEPPSYITNDQAEGIAPGPNDTVWFVLNQANQVDEFNIQTQQFIKQAPAAPPGNNNPPSALLWSIAEGPDGNMYYVEPGLNGIGVSNASGPVAFITNVSPQPQPNFLFGVMANGVAGYPNIFATEPELGLMVYVNTTKYSDGLPLSSLPLLTYADDAESIVSVNNELVFTNTAPNPGVALPPGPDGEIGVFNPYTQLDTMYPLPQIIFPNEPDPLPNQLAVDSNGNVWFTETGINAIGEFVPSNGAIFQTFLTEFGSAPVGIAWDAPEKQFWMTEPSLGQIVSFNPATSGSAVAPFFLPNASEILVDPKTGWLWITLTNAGDTSQPGLIIEYQPVSEQILNVYPLNGNYNPGNLIWGPDGNIWFTETGLDSTNNPIGAIGVMDPTTGIINDIPTDALPTDLAVGPTSTGYGNTIWATENNSGEVGQIDVPTQSVVGYVAAPYSSTNYLVAGPDGNEWFTGGLGNPTTWLGAVVLNPIDLPTQIAITTQPTSVQQTVFGGFVYGFGLVVSVENSQGVVDPFAQAGTIGIGLVSNPSGATLTGWLGSPLSAGTDYDVNFHIVDPGVAWFEGLTMDKVGVGYTIGADYTDPAGNDFTAVSDPFYVSGAPDHLIVRLNLNPPIPPSTTPYVNAGQTFTATVTAVDSMGLVIPNFDDAILMAIDNNPPVNNNPPGLGVLNGTTPFGALYGNAAFNDLSIDQAGNGYTLEVSDITVGSSLPAVVTGAFNVVPGPAVQLVIPAIAGAPPFTIAAGSPFQLVAYAEDKFGNVAPTFNNDPVAINLATGQTGTFNDEGEKVNANLGVVTFSGLAIDTVGTYNLTVSDPNKVLTPATSGLITIIPNVPAQLVWAVQPPSEVTEGIGFGATIDVEDQYGNLETGYTQNVTVAIDNNPPGTGVLGGIKTVQAVGGVATFAGLTISTIGNPYTLVATSVTQASTTLTSPPSANIDVVAPQLVVTSQPTGSVTAGVGFQLVVTAETYLGTTDTAFTGTVGLQISTAPTTGAPLLGTTTANANNGVATFPGVILDIAGSYVLEATSGNLLAGFSKTITVVAAPASALTVTQEPPSSVEAGKGFGFVVGGQDQFGNPTSVTGAATVQIQTNPGNSMLGGILTVPASGGLVTFSGLTLNKVASGYILEVTSGTLTPALTSAIQVYNAPATKLVIQPAGEPPSTETAGVEFTMVVDAEDQFGNLDLNYTGPVSVAIANGVSGTLTGTIPQTASGGVATFSDLAIDTSGTFQLQATSGSLSPGTSTDIAVNPAAPAKLVWATEPPGTLVHDLSFGGVIDVEDQYGNLETGYTQNVGIALDVNPTNASLGGGNTTVSGAGGVANFSGITISAVGNGYTLVATSTTSGGSVLTSPQSTPINVTPTPAVSVSVTQEPPPSVMVYQTFNIQVTALDQFGKPDPDFGGSITIGLSGASGVTLDGPQLTEQATNGVANFSGLYLTTVADGYTIVATSTGLNQGTSTPFNVTAGPATQLVIATEPAASVNAGSQFGFVVSAEDQYGNLATSFNGSVTAALAAFPTGGALTGADTATANDGVAVFSALTIDQAGSGYKLSASSTGLTGITTTAFKVAPIAASQLVFSAEPPTSLTAGDTFGVTVTAEDPFGNVATSYSGPVSLALSANPGTGTLGGILNGGANQGQAVFSGLYLDTAGSGYVIQATSGSLTAATSTAIGVSPGTATTLVIGISPPTTMTSGHQFGLAIWAEDSYGNLATSFDGTVNLALVNNPGNATLSGPLTATATAGVTNFQAYITTDIAATGYTLQATSTGLSPVTTGGITVIPSPATQLIIQTQPPSLLTPGATFGLVVAAKDQYGNVDPSFTGNVTLTVSSGSSTLGGKTTLAVTDGLATFTGLTLTQSSTSNMLQAASTGLTPALTSGISVTTPAQLAFSASSVTVNEKAGTATLTVNRTGGYQGAVTVNVATSGGTAKAGVNYTAVSQPLSFALNQDSQTVTIPILNAGVLKTSVSVNVVLSSPSANAGLGSQSTETVTIQNATPPVPLVTVKKVLPQKNSSGKVTSIVITFSGAVNKAEAQAIATYNLVAANASGSFSGSGTKKIQIKSAVYANNSVTLTTAAFGLSRSVQLTIYGKGANGLQDAEGRYIDGAHNGAAGSNAVAILSKSGVSVSVVPKGPLALKSRGAGL